jgi:AraC-like DNA-binding protein
MLIGGEFGGTEAGFLVGYERASQFSREYRQLFGSPPSQDIARLRDDADLRLAGRP